MIRDPENYNFSQEDLILIKKAVDNQIVQLTNERKDAIICDTSDESIAYLTDRIKKFKDLSSNLNRVSSRCRYFSIQYRDNKHFDFWYNNDIIPISNSYLNSKGLIVFYGSFFECFITLLKMKINTVKKYWRV